MEVSRYPVRRVSAPLVYNISLALSPVKRRFGGRTGDFFYLFTGKSFHSPPCARCISSVAIIQSSALSLSG